MEGGEKKSQTSTTGQGGDEITVSLTIMLGLGTMVSNWSTIDSNETLAVM